MITQSKKKNIIRIMIASIIALLIIVGLVYCISEIVQIFMHSMNKNLNDGFIKILRKSRAKGVIAFILVQAIIIASIFLPAMPVQTLIGAVYGPIVGVFVSMGGIMLGNIFTFLVIRSIGVGIEFLHKNKKQHKFIEKFLGLVRSENTNIVLMAILLFLLPVFPYGIICFIMANSRIKTWQFALVSTFASLLDVVTNNFMGTFFEHGNWIFGGVFACIVIILFVISIFKKDFFMNFIIKKTNNKEVIDETCKEETNNIEGDDKNEDNIERKTN